MQKLVRFFGRPLFFYFSFFFIFNANGQLISAKMEKDFREDARIKVARVAKMIDQGVKDTKKKVLRVLWSHSDQLFLQAIKVQS